MMGHRPKKGKMDGSRKEIIDRKKKRNMHVWVYETKHLYCNRETFSVQHFYIMCHKPKKEIMGRTKKERCMHEYMMLSMHIIIGNLFQIRSFYITSHRLRKKIDGPRKEINDRTK